MSIIYLEKDIKLFQKMQNEALKLKIHLIHVTSIEDFKSHSRGKAGILNEHFLNHDSLSHFPCSIIYTYLPSPLQLQELKKNPQIQLVAGRPESSEELRYLLLSILGKQMESCDWIQDIPPNLMQEYLKLAYERLGLVLKLIQEIKTHPTTSSYNLLEETLHKIAGSSGMYGRLQASELSKALEIKLKNKDYHNLDLDNFYRKLFLFIQ